MTNKMQRYTIFLIVVNVLHVSGGFSAHHQELKNCKHSIRYMSSLLAATASVGESFVCGYCFLLLYVHIQFLGFYCMFLGKLTVS